MPVRATTAALILTVVWLPTIAGTASAQGPRGPALPASQGDSSAPIEISADRLEVLQNERVATFDGNVDAAQGDWRLRSEKLRVYYAATESGARPTISRLDASGQVRMTTADEAASGDEATYSVETGAIVMTGNVEITSRGNSVRGRHLVSNRNTGYSTLSGGRIQGRFVPTPAASGRTARPATGPATSGPISVNANALDVQQNSQTARFYGSVEAEQADLRLRADVLHIHYNSQDRGNQQAVSRIDANGNVFVSTGTETAKGDDGVYDVARGLVTLTGDVVLTREGNVIRGRQLVVDLVSGQSQFDAAAGGGRVQGLFTPGGPRP
ncbi:MAG: hypothetical protein FJX65_00915 [Alphaproteobacteria bacterium]|nr:hypothetical protein [Alphaproteobacteria bacterium]